MAAIDRLLNAAENVVAVIPKCIPTDRTDLQALSNLHINELFDAMSVMNLELNNKAIEENKAAAETEMRLVPTVPSLRDHFAGLAMAQIIARGEVTNDAIALYAYKQADAMLKARGQ
jgi:hypothetical protein